MIHIEKKMYQNYTCYASALAKIDNHLLVLTDQIYRNCVMIDLPSLAMQNIMLPWPTPHELTVYCRCSRQEKPVQGTECVTRKQRVHVHLASFI